MMEKSFTDENGYKLLKSVSQEADFLLSIQLICDILVL